MNVHELSKAHFRLCEISKELDRIALEFRVAGVDEFGADLEEVSDLLHDVLDAPLRLKKREVSDVSY